MADQSHALRVRTFMHYLQQSPDRGAFVCIDASTDDQKGFASTFPTTLRRLSLDQFDRIAYHGYQVALNVEIVCGPGSVSADICGGLHVG